MNIMRLASPESAILSAVIFNALIIIALIPLALRGVQYRPVGASTILTRNLLIYGLGGVIIPFVGIKAIDLIIYALHLVQGETMRIWTAFKINLRPDAAYWNRVSVPGIRPRLASVSRASERQPGCS